jgi:hypothetical protein
MKRKPGRPKGTTGIKKSRLKPDEKKRTVRKLYEWTPEEYSEIEEAVKRSGRKESDIIRSGALAEVRNINAV